MNFKNNKILSALLLLTLTYTTGCYKDKSNDGLTPINTVQITDPLTAGTVTVFQGDVLRLKPTLTLSMTEKMDKLEFSWLVYNSNGQISLASPRAVISNQYELNYLIQGEPFILGEPYIVRLAVKDTETGVISYINYKVSIGNKYGTGWLVLEDKAGNGDLSFIFPDSTVEHQIYSSRNTAPLVGPKKLELTPFVITDGISDVGKRLYILAETGSQEYNYLTMVKKFDYGFEFYIAPTIQKPTVMTWLSTTSGSTRSANIGIVINNGKAHSNLVGGFPGTKKWGDIALTPQGTTNYSLAPYAVGGPGVAAMIYDNTSKRFYNIIAFSNTPGAGSLTAFPAIANTPGQFDLNNVGKTMIFQDSSDVVHTYNSVMKGDDNLPYLYRYKTANTSTATPNLSISNIQMNAPGILNYTAAASSTNTGHIYYSNANVISRYEVGSNSIVETYTFPAGENVTAIKYAKYNFNDKEAVKRARLVVGTWNGTEGKLYYFALSQTGSIGSYTKQFTGFGKIVDLAYKY
ncbi:PKD-like family lipoprotein [Pedobacter metabolipauper]|uniref:PKD family protein n=1 Tax=Pedobacter metabolipauper TaxID=425513 RepID=A0A4R6SXN3_9SPHI|nr:PKD-like family lipoprotein [Pedobacter metabolipauper]TDQ11156.1 PKD family protein [Pedobacter metabolipauper]